jgi:multisubunit Na+/H+ antiporter MnhC subunit
MVLTGIVVTVAITGFAVTLIRRSVHGRGRANLPEDGVGP